MPQMMRQVLKVKPARKNQPEILPEQQKPQKMVIDMFIKPLVGLIFHFMYFNPIKHRHRKKDPRLFFSLVVVGLQATQAKTVPDRHPAETETDSAISSKFFNTHLLRFTTILPCLFFYS
ncbi:MAG: hypothetical protein HN703_00565 [Planctomycetaceae bacterium]|nr:hypothetical protein [Planctomycetaceae bacterium]